MPMGWKHAPCIAQRTSLVIADRIMTLAAERGIDCIVRVWVDNFIFGAHDLREAKLVWDIAVSVFTECNLEMHPRTEFKHDIDVLGCHLSHSKMRHSDKFCTSFVTALESITFPLCPTYREIGKVLGNISWSVFVRHLPLACFPETRLMMSLIAVHIAQGAKWDDPCTLDTLELVAEAKTFADTVPEPFPIMEEGDPCHPFVEMFSDAMVDSVEATWAYTSGSHSEQGTFDTMMDIFIHELLAACYALQDAACRDPTCHVVLFTDNSGVVHAMRAGHSGNGIADFILKEFFETLPLTFTFNIAHISGDFNPADRFTRGAVATRSGDWLFTRWG